MLRLSILFEQPNITAKEQSFCIGIDNEVRVMLEEELTGLNDAQSEVVSNLNDNLLVMAPAGTGKTKVISLRVAGFINQGIEAKEILCLTFTNKACHE